MRQVKANTKRKAITTSSTYQQNLGAELQNISATAAVNLPAIKDIERNIRNQSINQIKCISLL